MYYTAPILGSDSTAVNQKPDINELEEYTPVVGLLVQGSPRTMEQVFYYITNKMPVVVLKGSGGLADMIAYTFDELNEKFVFMFDF